MLDSAPGSQHKMDSEGDIFKAQELYRENTLGFVTYSQIIEEDTPHRLLADSGRSNEDTGQFPRVGWQSRHPGSPVPSLSAKVTASFPEGFASSKQNPWTHYYQLVLLEICVSLLSLRCINRWVESSHVKLCRACFKLMSLLLMVV